MASSMIITRRCAGSRRSRCGTQLEHIAGRDTRNTSLDLCSTDLEASTRRPCGRREVRCVAGVRSVAVGALTNTSSVVSRGLRTAQRHASPSAAPMGPVRSGWSIADKFPAGSARAAWRTSACFLVDLDLIEGLLAPGASRPNQSTGGSRRRGGEHRVGEDGVVLPGRGGEHQHAARRGLYRHGVPRRKEPSAHGRSPR